MYRLFILAYLLLIFVVASLPSCIGTDYVDVPLEMKIDSTPERAEVIPFGLSTDVGLTHQLIFNLLTVDSIVLEAEWQWLSRDTSIATVDSNGLITARAVGQTWIIGTANTIFSDSVRVTVNECLACIASVRIEGDNSPLKISASRQLTSVVSTIAGDILPNFGFDWSSSDESIATVDFNGLVTAVGSGDVEITASALGTPSQPLRITCAATISIRTGTFTGRNGNTVRGTGAVETINGDDRLVLRDNFRTTNDSRLYVYLTNSDDDVENGVNLGELGKTAGSQIYDITESTDPDLYDHIVILSDSLAIPVGAALLDE